MTTPDDARKRAEIEYPDRIGEDGRRWLATKPFGGPTRETARHVHDVAYIITLLDVRSGMRICELGCGSGWLTRFLVRCDAEAIGYDISPEMIRVAREAAEREGVGARFEVGDMEDEVALAGTFDACVLYDALHHSPHADRVLATARRVLRPGGVLVLAEPNWKHRWQGRDAVRTYGTTEMGYSSRGLKRMVRQAGFDDVRRFHNNRKRLYDNAPLEILAHLAEPLVYRALAPFWTQIWIRAVACEPPGA